MRYIQLRAFHAVARELSFSKAADALHVTQPAVTLHVQALEKAYGLLFFNRAQRTISLTAEGQTLLTLTRSLFDAEAQIGDFLAGAKALEHGQLSLSADGPHIALDIVSGFRTRHPGIDVKMKLGNAETTLHDIVNQNVDAGVLANPPRDKRLLVVPITRQNMVAIVPVDHPWARRKSVALRDLSAQPVILREPGSNTRRTLEQILRKHKIELAPSLELGSREAVREAVAVGLGIGFVQARETVGDTRIASVQIPELAGTNLDTLVCLKRHAQRRTIAALIDVTRSLSQLR